MDQPVRLLPEGLLQSSCSLNLRQLVNLLLVSSLLRQQPGSLLVPYESAMPANRLWLVIGLITSQALRLWQDRQRLFH